MAWYKIDTDTTLSRGIPWNIPLVSNLVPRADERHWERG